MARLLGLHTFALAVLFCVASGQPCVPVYNTTSSRIEGKLNVHLVPHTHDDVGWLKTVDQYYFGSRQDIQLAGVQYVLDTVIPSLVANKDRSFIYGEIAFFVRWWFEQTDTIKDAVRQLVAEGRLEFVNGGYVQHDEAAAHYVAMIDQTTRGHRWLNATFGKLPTAGWQIDPFGHSSTHASLLCGYLGFDALFFGRADYQDMERRRKTKELELLWRGSASYGTEADVFTGNFADGNYNPPSGFNYDWGSWDRDNQIQDNVCLEEINVDERVEQFVQACKRLGNMTRGNDIMIPMGTDFTYSNAWPWFKNMDKLIHHTNLDGRINVLYSTPSQYVAAKHAYSTPWPLKTDDFFPYADCPTCYWTGYFTSRPTSKAWIRSSTSFLQAVRQLEFLTPLTLSQLKPASTSDVDSSLKLDKAPETVWEGSRQLAGEAAATPLIGPASDALEEVVSLLQHHDAITGTEKQHVANDYHRRLHAGLGKGIVVPVYNPLGWERQELVRVPISLAASKDWTVKGPDGKAVQSQILPTSSSTKRVQDAYISASLAHKHHAGEAELVFLASVPPLGYAVYSLDASSKRRAEGNAFVSLEQSWSDYRAATSELTEDLAIVANDDMVVKLGPTGQVTGIQDVSSGASVSLGLSLTAYNSSDALGPEPRKGPPAPPSGAYIFRPDGEKPSGDPLEARIAQGPVLTENRVVLEPWGEVTIRAVQGLSHLEIEWTVGPLPFKDGFGREVALRYTTNLTTGSTFYTDANGREMQKRERDHRPSWDLNVTQPVAGNYYPLTAAIYLEEPGFAQLGLITDRAQGGGSLRSGELEIMVHRRTMFDDERGVGEPINETLTGCFDCQAQGLIARGTHHLALKDTYSAATYRRTLQQRVNDPLVMIRLAHLFQVNESSLAHPVKVDLGALFEGFSFESAVELSLSGGKELSQVKRLSWQAGQDISKRGGADSSAGQRADSAASAAHTNFKVPPAYNLAEADR
ncbi:hypothetical protein WJX73_000911 [Symbiochloris irregularis]|uniref:Alpha-mannosidase n=1 Tax=Symbiochloris irregularis TaxID=706552 RepID=A0AAW1NM24_9CHLO